MGSGVLHASIERQDHAWLSRSEIRFVGVSWVEPHSPKHEAHKEGSEFPAKLRRVSTSVMDISVKMYPIFEKPVPLSQMIGARSDIDALCLSYYPPLSQS